MENIDVSGHDAGRPAGILVVEDESSLAEAICYNLEREGFRTFAASEGHQALEMFRRDLPALVLLDLMLPGLSGLDLCRLIRSESDVPIIMVTAKTDEVDKVAGLELGADDYVTKPFSMRELVSRVRAQLRRADMSLPKAASDILAAGPVKIDIQRHEVYVEDERVELPPKEFALLEALVRRAGRLVTRERLISEIWGAEYFGDTRTLDVHVKRVRSKVEVDPRSPKLITTVRGLGYKFEG